MELQQRWNIDDEHQQQKKWQRQQQSMNGTAIEKLTNVHNVQVHAI